MNDYDRRQIRAIMRDLSAAWEQIRLTLERADHVDEITLRPYAAARYAEAAAVKCDRLERRIARRLERGPA